MLLVFEGDVGAIELGWCAYCEAGGLHSLPDKCGLLVRCTVQHLVKDKVTLDVVEQKVFHLFCVIIGKVCKF